MTHETALRTQRLIPYLVIAALLVVLLPTLWPHDGVGDTFRYWYAGHIVASGGSPYDQNAWAAAGGLYGDLAENVSSSCSPTPYEPACLWAYPPITAPAFALFGMLEIREGLDAVAAFVVLAGLSGLVLVGWWIQAVSVWTRVVALSAGLLSHAFVFDVHAGHFEGLGLIGMVSVAVGLQFRRGALVAVGAMLLSMKPHLYLALAAAVLVLLVLRRDWRTLSWTFVAVAVTNGLALLRYPEAVNAILGRTGSVIGLGWATTWSFATSLFPDLPAAGVLAVYGIAAVACFSAIRLAPPDRRIDVAIAASAALALTVSPYVQPYDLLVLFPAFALSIAIVERGGRAWRRAFIALIAATLVAGTWLAISVETIVTGSPGIMPVVALVVLAIAIWSARRGGALKGRLPRLASATQA